MRPYYLTEPDNFPCGRKQEYVKETYNFWQGFDYIVFSHEVWVPVILRGPRRKPNPRPKNGKASSLTISLTETPFTTAQKKILYCSRLSARSLNNVWDHLRLTSTVLLNISIHYSCSYNNGKLTTFTFLHSLQWTSETFCPWNKSHWYISPNLFYYFLKYLLNNQFYLLLMPSFSLLLDPKVNKKNWPAIRFKMHFNTSLWLDQFPAACRNV